jgi:uncharacterized protein (DUF58 family)
MALRTVTRAESQPVKLLLPEVLMALANLDLMARTAIEGFFIGLHRSPDFGFSQEFAEYRAYQEGDDLRFIDWNVFARTERAYLKQYLGETNTHLMLMLDASASMGYRSGKVSKLDCGKILGASLAYLAKRQHDSIGLLVFDDEVTDFRPPRGGSSALPAVVHGLERAAPRRATAFAHPIRHYCERLNRAGILAVLSDFLAHPERILDELKPLRGRRQDVILFQVLDPEEIEPRLDKPARLEDMETGVQVNVEPGFMTREYRERMSAHIQRIRDVAAKTGADHVLVKTNEPIDAALRSYLLHRSQRR